MDIPKTIDELNDKHQNKARGLANIFTNIRQFSYFIVYISMPLLILYLLYLNAFPILGIYVLGIFVAFYMLFQTRDYIRGDI